jgi:ERF superfamily
MSAPDPTAPHRKKASRRAVALRPEKPVAGLPELFARAAQSPNFDVDALTKLMALKREIEAEAERRAFDQDFAALQAEIVRVEANAFDPQKRRAYADLNALVEAVGPLAAVKGFALAYDTEPSAVAGAVKVTVKLMRNGVERVASVDVPMDGAGMRGGANMSAPQAYGSTITYGRKLALTLMFNLTVSGGSQQKFAEPAAQRFPERQRDEAPPWDVPPRRNSDDHLAVFKRAAGQSRRPASDKQINWLADLLGKRGEPASAVLEADGSLSSKAAGQAIDARAGGRS